MLQPSGFTQNFTGATAHTRGSREASAILTASGYGRIGFVDAADIAAVAVRRVTGEPTPTPTPTGY
ncbi:hypothetical protein [Streptomyces sp. cg36]|uniref:hypothetical protein n=1 Tax=Streptomyces sp. cg36 TaxID=3238798 RepID=UPI0034E2E37C